MTTKYRIIFHGLTKHIESFKARMAQLGVPPETVHKMIDMAPVSLKGGLSFEAAKKYAQTVQEAGGRVTIAEHKDWKLSNPLPPPIIVPAFGDFTMCPQCGFKQPKAAFCAKCGLGLHKDLKAQTR
ncbi:MAG: hypothetical protein SV686_07575 [Thermodesulfobacteriota bacterium]|nr:hypothetical protein [Thermodesulfobacteriota bacterium]